MTNVLVFSAAAQNLVFLRVVEGVASMGVEREFGHSFSVNFYGKTRICQIWTPLGQGGVQTF